MSDILEWPNIGLRWFLILINLIPSKMGLEAEVENETWLWKFSNTFHIRPDILQALLELMLVLSKTFHLYLWSYPCKIMPKLMLCAWIQKLLYSFWRLNVRFILISCCRDIMFIGSSPYPPTLYVFWRSCPVSFLSIFQLRKKLQ